MVPLGTTGEPTKAKGPAQAWQTAGTTPLSHPASTLCPLQRGQGGSTNLAELVAQLQLTPTPHQPHEIQGLQPESLHPVLRQQ